MAKEEPILAMKYEAILKRLTEILSQPEIADLLRKRLEEEEPEAAICSGCCLLAGGGASSSLFEVA